METSLSLLERLTGTPTEEDWRRLAGLYEPLLRVWLARAGVPEADRDDLLQEVLLAVFRDVGTFEHGRPGAFRSWLRTLLTHRTLDYFRRRQRRAIAPGGAEAGERLAQLEDPHSEMSKLWDREHDQFVAQQAIERVRGDFAEATWEAFQRYVLDAEPASTVAAALGLSLNSVLLAKSRVLKRLRQEVRGFVD